MAKFVIEEIDFVEYVRELTPEEEEAMFYGDM